MVTSSYVRRYINRLAPNTLFSTSQLLSCGKRAAVDQALSRLVKRGDIIRLTRGLFLRDAYTGSSISLAPSKPGLVLANNLINGSIVKPCTNKVNKTTPKVIIINCSRP